MNLTYTVATAIALAAAVARAAAVLIGAARSWRLMLPWTWSPAQIIVAPEPFALAAAAWLLYNQRQPGSTVTTIDALAAVTGATVAVTGLGMLAWAFTSWPRIFVGHTIKPGHQLVTRGAYSCVRHPAYTSGLLIWAGLAIAFHNLTVAAVAALYVAPAYLLYARSEETMMLNAFGQQYRHYQASVPTFIPRRTRPHRAASQR